MKRTYQKTILTLALAVFLIGITMPGHARSGIVMPGLARVTSIGVDKSYELIQKHGGDDDFVILDVRTPKEYSDGHLENALNVDYYADTFKDELNALDRNKTYLVYCRTGGRSGSTLRMMRELGFKNVYNMEGGYTEWVRRNYPVAGS